MRWFLDNCVRPLVHGGVGLFSSELGSEHGFRVVGTVPDENLPTVQTWVVSALRLLACYAPTHLRWLRRSIEVILLGRLPDNRWFRLLPRYGIIRVDPRLAVHWSAEQLALELLAASVWVRFRKGGFWAPGRRARILHRAAVERRWLATRLPGADRLAAFWADKLSDGDDVLESLL